MITETTEHLARNADTHYWAETATPAQEGLLATQYALANGYLGLRGTHEEMPSWASPGFYVAGTYCAAPQALIPIHSSDHILTHPERVKPEHHADYTELVTMPNLPNPVAVRLTIGGEPIDLDAAAILACERVMHMDVASVTRRLVVRDRAGRRTIIDSERFVSWANPNMVCFRYTVTPDGHDAAIEVTPYINTATTNARGLQLYTVAEQHASAGLNVLTAHISKPAQRVQIAQAYVVNASQGATVLDVVVGVHPQRQHDAIRLATDGLAAGFDALRADHRRAVDEAYDRSWITIDADPLTVQGFNFGHMQLEMALCKDTSAVSVPIKGLTGEGYRFMVFWDTDFHMFHYYLLTQPGQAKQLILYRFHQLDAYRKNAQAWGYRGAQVPWETGTSGEEETAPWLCLQERELHISADAAYMVKLYDDLTDDDGLLVAAGAELVFETARFYASRVSWKAESNRYEFLDVGCPDQYHTFADNNVFISRMAKWNLEYAAQLASDIRLAAVRETIGLTDDEVAEFGAIAEQLYIIGSNAEGIIEEFDGFFQLSTDLRGISETFCAHTQAVKQPDVVALFGPFYDEYPLEIQQKNWRYYADRTMHGSSLSLPGMALAAAMAGMPEAAISYFQRSARMDLDDVNRNTHLGVHLAGYAVQWETVVYGFAGVRLQRDRVEITPSLPKGWGGVSCTLHWRGCRITLRLTHAHVIVTAAKDNCRAVPIVVAGTQAISLTSGMEYTYDLG